MARRSSTARRYAEAAFQLASRDGTVDEWAAGLDLAAQLLTDERILPLVDSPARPYRDRLATIGRLLDGHVPAGVARLAGLLSRKGSVERIAAIVVEYHRLLDRQRGVVQASVASAV